MNTLTRRTGRLRNPLAMLLALMVVASGLVSGMTSSPANGQTIGAPGETLTLTDPYGNTFTFSLTLVSTGTGHGTQEQCFINTDNGYAVGDDTPEDEYVCIADSSQYRLDWNQITGDTPQSVEMIAGSVNDSVSVYDGATRTGSGWTGVVGGPDLGFTGTSPRTVTAQVTFDANSSSSGFFTYTAAANDRDAAGVYEVFVDVFNTDRRQGLRAVSDRKMTMLSGTRFDSRVRQTSVDSFNTVIDGEQFIGLNAGVGLPGYAGDRLLETRHPDFHGIKGVNPDLDLASSGLRYTVEHPVDGVYFSINGGTPVPALYDADGHPYIDSDRLDDQIRALLPYETVSEGITNYTVRLEPTRTILNTTGDPAFNGDKDPGIDLSCDTTTEDVYPGTGPGISHPNNNCAVIVYDKKVGSGTFAKRNSGTEAVVDGQAYNPATTVDGGNFYAVRSVLTLAPSSVPTGQMAVCDVWEPGQERLSARAKDIVVLSQASQAYTDRPTVEQAFPGAVVYWTAEDLRPTDGTNTPVCGSPGDGVSGWTTDRASLDENNMGGFLVVFPEDVVLRDTFYLGMSLTGTLSENYDELVTPGILNYMGVDPDIADGFDYPITAVDDITVIKEQLWWHTAYVRADNPAPIGAGTIPFRSGAMLFHTDGVMADPNGTVTFRTYVDKCFTSITPTSDDTVFHDAGDLGAAPDDCGAGESYLERIFTFSEHEEFLADNTEYLPKFLTWDATTPAWSAPGDTYENRLEAFVPEDSDYYWLRNGPSSARTGVTERIVVAPAAVVSSTKSTDDDVIEVRQSFTDTVGWFNYTDAELGTARFIDVLPYDGDERGSSFSGDLDLVSITYSGRPEFEGLTSFEYTSAEPSTIDDDPLHASNAAGGSTTWCDDDDLGVEGCPATLADVTAIRFTTTGFDSQVSQYFDLLMQTSGNLEGDRYVNSLSVGAVSGLGQPVPAPAPVEHRAVSGSIAGTVFEDADYSEAMDQSEARLEGYVVELLDGEGTVLESVTTGADGAYLFDNLVSGDYQVRLTDKQGYSVITVVGADTGEEVLDRTSQTIELAVDQDVTDVNIGLFKVLISGTVYEDLNDDGDQALGESPEPGIEGYGVELLDSEGAVIDSTTTDENGYYSFVVVPGEHQVRISDPDGRILTQSYTVSDPRGRTTDPTQPVTVETSDVHEIDFGLYTPLSMTVQKYGLVDGGTALLSGAQFSLTGPDGDLDMSLDEAGSAFFADGLRVGQEYVLTETKAPEGTNLLANEIVLTVTQDGIELTSGGSDLIKVSEQDPFVLMVTDSPAVELPSTGGAGVGNGVLLGLTVLLLMAAASHRSRTRYVARHT